MRHEPGDWQGGSGADIETADSVRTPGSPAAAGVRFTDSTPPGTPKVGPSDSKHVGGEVDPDDLGDAAAGDLDVVVIDPATGQEITRCHLDPARAEGDMLAITEADAAGNTSTAKPWRAGAPEVTLAKPTLCNGEQQAAMAKNFRPREAVDAVLEGSGAVGAKAADANGQVPFTWAVGKGVSQGKHVLSLTGADGLVGLTGGALGLLIAGWLLLTAAKRRRQYQEAPAREAVRVCDKTLRWHLVEAGVAIRPRGRRPRVRDGL